MASNWTHPTHARGILSPRLDVRGGKLLSDRKIHAYAKEGRYGTEVQAAALGKPRVKRAKSVTLEKAMKALIARTQRA